MIELVSAALGELGSGSALKSAQLSFLSALQSISELFCSGAFFLLNDKASKRKSIFMHLQTMILKINCKKDGDLLKQKAPSNHSLMELCLANNLRDSIKQLNFACQFQLIYLEIKIFVKNILKNRRCG